MSLVSQQDELKSHMAKWILIFQAQSYYLIYLHSIRKFYNAIIYMETTFTLGNFRGYVNKFLSSLTYRTHGFWGRIVPVYSIMGAGRPDAGGIRIYRSIHES